MSVADMLAAARAEKSGGAPAAEEPAAEAPAAEPEPAAEAEAPAETSSDEVVGIDKSSMSVADMVAYCREKDA